MENSGKSAFKELLVRCFGDMASPILNSPIENIPKCSLGSLNAFVSSLSDSVAQAVVEGSDEGDIDALMELNSTYRKVYENLVYFKDSEMSQYARKYLEDNHVNLKSENGARDFALFEDCMNRHKKDFLSETFAVEDFLIPDIFHTFLDDTMSMFKEEREEEIFSEVMARVA